MPPVWFATSSELYRVIHAFQKNQKKNVEAPLAPKYFLLQLVLQWARQWYHWLCAAISECFIADSAQHAQGMCSVGL